MTDAELLKELDALKATMIAVSTGGPRIGEVEHEFAERFDAVSSELATRRVANTLPYRDLWQWYGRWSSGDLPTYASRRGFVADLFDPIIFHIRNGPTTANYSPTGWDRVDRTVTELEKEISPTDAKRMLEAYIVVVLAGGAHEHVRKHARAALDLAVHLQHRRTATFREAAICVEATTSVINLIAIIAGRRDS